MGLYESLESIYMLHSFFFIKGLRTDKRNEWLHYFLSCSSQLKMEMTPKPQCPYCWAWPHSQQYISLCFRFPIFPVAHPVTYDSCVLFNWQFDTFHNTKDGLYHCLHTNTIPNTILDQNCWAIPIPNTNSKSHSTIQAYHSSASACLSN